MKKIHFLFKINKSACKLRNNKQVTPEDADTGQMGAIWYHLYSGGVPAINGLPEK